MQRVGLLLRRCVTTMLTKRQRNNWGALLDLDEWFAKWQQENKQLDMHKDDDRSSTTPPMQQQRWRDLLVASNRFDRFRREHIDTAALVSEDFSINTLPALKIICDSFDMMQKNPAFRNWTDSEWLLALTVLTQYQSLKRKRHPARIPSEHVIQDVSVLDLLTRYVRICDSVYASSIDRFCKESGLSRDCIVHSQEGSVFSPKYVLLVLHETKEILLVVRGSASLLDLCTDFALVTVPFRNGHGHGGIVHAANWLMRKTHDELLQLAKTHPDYSVVFTGHSLGAGVAALAAMEMRTQIPHVQCVAFATPACVTLEIAKQCKDFVTTVVNGDDVVPRFHPFSLLQLQKQVASFNWRSKLKEMVDEQVARQKAKTLEEMQEAMELFEQLKDAQKEHAERGVMAVKERASQRMMQWYDEWQKVFWDKTHSLLQREKKPSFVPEEWWDELDRSISELEEISTHVRSIEELEALLKESKQVNRCLAELNEHVEQLASSNEVQAFMDRIEQVMMITQRQNTQDAVVKSSTVQLLDRVVTISEEINSRIDKQVDQVAGRVKNKLDEWTLESKNWWDQQAIAGPWKRKQQELVPMFNAVWSSPAWTSQRVSSSSIVPVDSTPAPVPQVVKPAPVPAPLKRMSIDLDASLSDEEMEKMKWFPPGRIIVLQDEPSTSKPAQLVRSKNTEFSQLVLSNAMLINHLCTEYEKVLKRAK